MGKQKDETYLMTLWNQKKNLKEAYSNIYRKKDKGYEIRLKNKMLQNVVI